MYTIISPSKTQNFNRTITLPKGIEKLSKVPEWNTQTAQLAKVMRAYSAEELSLMMKVSPKLGALTFARFQEWDADYGKKHGDETQVAPAIVAFLGDVYKGFKLEEWTIDDYKYAKEHLGIASGFYGLMSALDYMQPYRLEMGTRVAFTIDGVAYKNLYAFWSEILTEKMFRILKKSVKKAHVGFFDTDSAREVCNGVGENTKANSIATLINLASVEYSKVIDRKLLKQKCIDNWRGGDKRVEMQIIDIDFKIRKANKKTGEIEEKVVGIYAKRARGEMANWIIENKIENPKDLQKFSIDGWEFRDESTKDALGNVRMLFVKSL